MILKANQKYIDMSCVRHLLATGEKNADYLTFEISKKYHDVDLSECNFILRAVNSSGNLVEQTLKKLIDDNSIFLTWTIDEYFTAVSGVLKLEIRGVKGDELVIKYDLSDIIVRESAVGEGLPEIPDTTVIQGEKGDKGDDGLSAYEIWLSIGNSGTEADFITSLKGDTGGQGIQGEMGEAGKSAYETWLSFGNSGTETDFIASLKGARGEQGLQGIQGEIGLTGERGADGKSAYQTWLSLGNSGTEADFIMSLKGEQGLQGIKGEKGDTGEQGLQGVQGEIGLTGESGKDGFSPTIEVCENTETSYRLLITNKTNTFETPNLKGLNDISNDKISALQNQISNLNKLISTLQTGGGNLKVTTLFDSSDYEKYKNLWNFKCSYWDDRVFSFDETATKNTTFCNDKNSYSMRFSNSFGWGADITAICSEVVEINDKSVLIVDYNCSADGDAMTAEIIPEADFMAQKTADFEAIPAFYAVSTSYISANFRLISAFESGSYYIRLKVNTTNPVFTVRKIIVVSG